MKSGRKSKLSDFWSRLIADVKQDNLTKVSIAEQTIQNALTGIQDTLNPDRVLARELSEDFSAEKSMPWNEKAEKTWARPVTDEYELAQYREVTQAKSRKKYAGRLFILRKRER